MSNLEAFSPGLDRVMSVEGVENIHANSFLRVEEKIHHVWNGVNDCCLQTRIDGETNGRFEQWRNEQISKHPDLAVLRSGWLPSKVKCRNSDGGLWGANNCSGSTTQHCFIVFLLPQPLEKPPIQYHIPYRAIRRTQWISHPADASPETGNINTGDFVFLSDDFTGGQYEPAKLKNGDIQFVDLKDFKKY